VSFDKTGKEEAPALAGALQLVVIVMDYGFLAIAVLVFLLNHGLAVGMFVLLYDGAIAVMRLANRDASAGRPGMNSNIVSIRWGGDAEHNRRCNQIFLHVSLLHVEHRDERRRSVLVSEDNAAIKKSAGNCQSLPADKMALAGIPHPAARAIC
jgi:hypothetical protein